MVAIFHTWGIQMKVKHILVRQTRNFRLVTKRLITKFAVSIFIEMLKKLILG